MSVTEENRAVPQYELKRALGPLQLMGLVAEARGDLPAAVDYMQRSLQAHAPQPHVWNNLGTTLEDLGRLAEAEAAFLRALALKADYGDAHYNRARVLRLLGQDTAAGEALARAMQLSPPTPGMLQLKAMLD